MAVTPVSTRFKETAAMEYRATILTSQHLTHDVKRIVLSRPEGFHFTPGQGVELAINQPGWEQQGRPFTPTSLPEDKVIEFTIKGYPEHHGVTEQLHKLNPGDELLMSATFGTIQYHGPGTFIAAGAGITPFLAIIRRLAHDGELAGHQLLFSNKEAKDTICEQELRHYLGGNAHFFCTREEDCHCTRQRIDKAYLEKNITDLSQRFYLCGPPPFVEAINTSLKELGAKPDAVVFEH
jgi:cytochrome-b5 reductase